MVNQIEIFPPYDPIIQHIIQGCKVEYSIRYVDVTNNETGETTRVYVNEKEKKRMFNDPERYIEKYFKKQFNRNR